MFLNSRISALMVTVIITSGSSGSNFGGGKN
jgi:hypothetical protein